MLRRLSAHAAQWSQPAPVSVPASALRVPPWGSHAGWYQRRQPSQRRPAFSPAARTPRPHAQQRTRRSMNHLSARLPSCPGRGAAATAFPADASAPPPPPPARAGCAPPSRATVSSNASRSSASMPRSFPGSLPSPPRRRRRSDGAMPLLLPYASEKSDCATPTRGVCAASGAAAHAL
eukprot:361438-Chlamydomonas_euryale.AAC.4